MTKQIETSEDLDTMLLDIERPARFTVEEALARRDARNAQFDIGDL